MWMRGQVSRWCFHTEVAPISGTGNRNGRFSLRTTDSLPTAAGSTGPVHGLRTAEYSVDAHTADLVAILRRLDAGPVHLVGFSTADRASRHPARRSASFAA